MRQVFNTRPVILEWLFWGKDIDESKRMVVWCLFLSWRGILCVFLGIGGGVSVAHGVMLSIPDVYELRICSWSGCHEQNALAKLFRVARKLFVKLATFSISAISVPTMTHCNPSFTGEVRRK